MSNMSLFEAKEPDLKKERRHTILISTVVVIVLLAGILGFWFRHWPEEHRVDQMFQAIERNDFEAAYALWTSDPQWKQHPEKYKLYPIGVFETDFGPGSEWGQIKKHHVDGSVVPQSRNTDSSGVIVKVTVNDIAATPACLWVEKKTKVIGFSPIPCR